MLQHAADPDSGGHGVQLYANALAIEILGFLDRIGIDADEAMAKYPRRKHGDGDKRPVPGDVPRDVLQGRRLRGIELAVGHHPVEDVARVLDLDEVDVQPGCAHLVGRQRDHAVVEGGCEVAGDGRHADTDRYIGNLESYLDSYLFEDMQNAEKSDHVV